jgi:hypothetical protein
MIPLLRTRGDSETDDAHFRSLLLSVDDDDDDDDDDIVVMTEEAIVPSTPSEALSRLR